MGIINFYKRHTVVYKIDKSIWHQCKICKAKISDLAKKYGGKGVYYSSVFFSHLDKDHKLTPEEYFGKYAENKICCADCNKKCSISKKPASNVSWKKMCGRNDGIKLWSEKAKITRKGAGNPAYGKKPWNKGLGLEDARVEKIASAHRNKPLTQNHKDKISKSGIDFIASGKTRGMSGKKHSDKTKERLRNSTLNLIKRGVFNQIKSKPHIIFKDTLVKLGIEFEEEKQLSFWSMDFYIPSINYYIEIDGDYFHSNPNTRWPNGPITKTQKIVRFNDNKKNLYCKNNNLNLIRFWEYDIFNNLNTITEKIQCLVQKSKQ